MAHIPGWRKEGRHLCSCQSEIPKTIVYSVNEDLTAEDRVISRSSCTTNCLAPMANT